MAQPLRASTFLVGFLATFTSGLRIGIQIINDETKEPVPNAPVLELCRPPNEKPGWLPLVNSPDEQPCFLRGPEMEESWDGYRAVAEPQGYLDHWAWITSEIRPEEEYIDWTFIHIVGPDLIPLTNNLRRPALPFQYGVPLDRPQISNQGAYLPSIFEVLRKMVPQKITNKNTLTTDDILLFAGQNANGIEDHQLQVGSTDGGPWYLIRHDAPLEGFLPCRLIITELTVEDVERPQGEEPVMEESIHEENIKYAPSMEQLMYQEDIKQYSPIQIDPEALAPKKSEFKAPRINLGESNSFPVQEPSINSGSRFKPQGHAREPPKKFDMGVSKVKNAFKGLFSGKNNQPAERYREESKEAQVVPSTDYRPRGHAREPGPKAQGKQTGLAASIKKLNPFARKKNDNEVTINVSGQDTEEQEAFEGAQSFAPINIDTGYFGNSEVKEPQKDDKTVFEGKDKEQGQEGEEEEDDDDDNDEVTIYNQPQNLAFYQDYMGESQRQQKPKPKPVVIEEEYKQTEFVKPKPSRSRLRPNIFRVVEGTVRSVVEYLPGVVEKARELTQILTKAKDEDAKNLEETKEEEEEEGVEMRNFNTRERRIQDDEEHNPEDDINFR